MRITAIYAVLSYARIYMHVLKALGEVWARSGRGLDEVWMRSGACLGHVWLVWVTSGSRLGRRLGLDPRVARPFNPESCMSSLGLIGLRSPKQISNLAYQVDGWSQAYEPTTAIIYSKLFYIYMFFLLSCSPRLASPPFPSLSSPFSELETRETPICRSRLARGAGWPRQLRR